MDKFILKFIMLHCFCCTLCQRIIASKYFKYKSIYKTTEFTMNFCPSLWQENKDNITTFNGNKGTWTGMQFNVN